MPSPIPSLVVVLSIAGALPQPAAAADSGSIRKLFADPPREYASAPLWVWNDMLTDEQIVSTLRELAAQGVKQAIVHPRPGLMTPYLSPEWFRLWKVALAEAEKLDMNIWIYDENSYPSGFAGGFVPEAMPDSRACGLRVKAAKKPPAPDKDRIAVFRKQGDVYQDVTSTAKSGDAAEGDYLVFSRAWSQPTPWMGGKWYTDLLKPGVTAKFLEITLDAYQREIGDAFGKRVPGVFTDEPNIIGAHTYPWTPALPELFQQRFGYSLTERLPSLHEPVGAYKRVRHDYFLLLHELFVEHWAKPYHDWCEKNGVEFTGHYWEHEWPNCKGVPDNMAMYAWHQRPAIDILMNQYAEHTHAQFGNVRACRELSSVANQLGIRRTLCEAYGAGGWDLRFEDMKRIADWLYVLGINTMDEHLSYITIRGARKHDHPQSFSYHEPWWEDYHVLGKYNARMCAAMSQGEQINPVLVIEPTRTAWMYNTLQGAPPLKQIGDTFFSLVMDLDRRQVEYDLGCEDIMAKHGSVDGKALVVGKRKYQLVVIPPHTETLAARTVDLLAEFVKAGGNVLSCGEPPALVDGRTSERLAEIARSENWRKVEAADVPERSLEAVGGDFVLRRARGDKGNLFHHRRTLADGELLLLVNTSLEAQSAGTISCTARSIEEWDAATGAIRPYPAMIAGGKAGAVFELPPAGSLLLFLSRGEGKNPDMMPPRPGPIAPDGKPAIRRLQPNVLTLDYVDLTVADQTTKNMYVLKACNSIFQKHGMERNPWDRAVQFKDELITKKFPPGSGFEATYRFAIEEKVPTSLEIVIERPDLYTISCNDQPVSATKGAWWLDKAFGRIDIHGVAKVGENTVTLKAAPMTIWHELDCAYVLGDFALKATERGFTIVPAADLTFGVWTEQGHPFYAAGVAYAQTFEVPKKTGRYEVALGKWYGSVARVKVNGKAAGHVYCAPWTCDVTQYVRDGANEIEVTVIGTLKNTLGPHHGNPALGAAWPGGWDNAPENPPAGKAYSVVGYGLIQPFSLRHLDH